MDLLILFAFRALTRGLLRLLFAYYSSVISRVVSRLKSSEKTLLRSIRFMVLVRNLRQIFGFKGLIRKILRNNDLGDIFLASDRDSRAELTSFIRLVFGGQIGVAS
jgi:hypothetical protein